MEIIFQVQNFSICLVQNYWPFKPLLLVIELLAIDFEIEKRVEIMIEHKLGVKARLWITERRNVFVFIKFGNDIESVIFLRTFKILSSSWSSAVIICEEEVEGERQEVVINIKWWIRQKETKKMPRDGYGHEKETEGKVVKIAHWMTMQHEFFHDKTEEVTHQLAQTTCARVIHGLQSGTAASLPVF